MPEFQKKLEEVTVLEPLIEIMKACYGFPRHGQIFDWKLILKFSLPAMILGPSIIFGAVGHVYITFKRGLWPEPIESLSFLLQVLMSFLILVSFFSNWKNFLKNIRRMKLYEFGIPTKCAVFARRVDYAITLVFYGVRVSCVGYGCLKYFDYSFCTNSGLAGDKGYICHTIFPLWYPIRMNTSGIELLLMIINIIMGMFYLPILCALTAIPLTACGFIIFRLEELKSLMMKYRTEGEYTRPLKPQKLKFFIKYHAEILECVQTMNDDMGYCHVSLQLFLPVLMALYLYKLIEQKDPAALIALFPWFFTLLCLCSFGERLEYERHSLYLVFNDIPWYRMDPKLRKMYHIFLGKLQCPLRMKVKSITDMNNIFLYKLLKATYTFLVYISSGK